MNNIYLLLLDQISVLSQLIFDKVLNVCHEVEPDLLSGDKNNFFLGKGQNFKKII
jgi:hypothetical protein